MTMTLEAIYEEGVLKLPTRLALPEKTRVTVTIQSPIAGEDAERGAWLKLSEDSLVSTWDNPEDDVFNELLQK